MSASLIFIRRMYVWGDLTTKTEPGNLTMVKMNAVSAVVLGGIGFHETGDIAAANGTKVIITILTILDIYLLPCIDSIFDEAEKLFICQDIKLCIDAPK